MAANGAEWISREIFRQALQVILMKKDDGVVETRSVEAWLQDKVADLDTRCK